MAVNAATVNADLSLALMPGEKVFSKAAGVRLSLESGGYKGYPGQVGSYYCSKGDAYVTNFRMVYVANPTMQWFKNVDVPLLYARDVNLYNSYFMGSSVSANVQPHGANSGLRSVAELKLDFLDGGANEFHTMLLYAQSLAHEEASASTSSAQGSSSRAASAVASAVEQPQLPVYSPTPTACEATVQTSPILASAPFPLVDVSVAGGGSELATSSEQARASVDATAQTTIPASVHASSQTRHAHAPYSSTDTSQSPPRYS